MDGPTRQIDGLLALVEAVICLANRSGVEPGWLLVGVEDDGRITGSRPSPPCAAYVHGYHPRENTRLQDQASTLEELLHSDTHFPPGSRILEADCGVGAQTVPLARNSPHSLITAVDISEASAGEARRRVAAAGLTNVQVLQADIFNFPFESGSFDHLFICFVLEHLPKPVEALRVLKDFIKPGGTITAIEGDHGSAYFYPDSEAAHRAISCQVELQKRAGGNAMIGRELYPLLCQAGFSEVSVSPRMVYVDSSKPELVEGFTRRTFTAMIEGVREAAVEAGIIGMGDFEAGVRDLYRRRKRMACSVTHFSKRRVERDEAPRRASLGFRGLYRFVSVVCSSSAHKSRNGQHDKSLLLEIENIWLTLKRESL